MKTVLLTLAAAISLTQTARAEIRIGADQIYPFLKCQGVDNVPDRTVTVILTRGGIAGLTELTVTHSTFAQVSSQKFVVTEKRSNQVGGAINYVGAGVRLTVNFTTSPMNDGGHHAVLQRDSKNGRYMPEELSCQTIYHTM